jgi:hypothetical protein
VWKLKLETIESDRSCKIAYKKTCHSKLKLYSVSNYRAKHVLFWFKSKYYDLRSINLYQLINYYEFLSTKLIFIIGIKNYQTNSAKRFSNSKKVY